MHINAQCFKQRMKRKEVGIRRTHKFWPGDRSHTLRALTTVTYWDGAKFQPQGRFLFFFFFFFISMMTPQNSRRTNRKQTSKLVNIEDTFSSCAKHSSVEAEGSLTGRKRMHIKPNTKNQGCNASGVCFSKLTRTFRARKASCPTAIRFV